jgi:hypothetical protein
LEKECIWKERKTGTGENNRGTIIYFGKVYINATKDTGFGNNMMAIRKQVFMAIMLEGKNQDTGFLCKKIIYLADLSAKDLEMVSGQNDTSVDNF